MTHESSASALSTTMAEQDGRLIIASSQDCTAIAEWCKRQHNEGNHGSSEMRFVGRIGNVMIEKYMNETGVTYAEFMAEECHIKAIMQNPENADFRIWKGAL